MTAGAKIPRYTEIPFPDKRYLPGAGMVHPKKHLGGSHIPQVPPSSVAFDVETWRFSQHYLYAVDLFNYQYWWEAHEVLEDLWMEAGRNTPIGKFIQGLIQISAALLKKSQSNQKGAHQHAVNGLLKIRSQPGVFLGVDIDAFGEQVECYIIGESGVIPEIRLRDCLAMKSD